MADAAATTVETQGRDSVPGLDGVALANWLVGAVPEAVGGVEIAPAAGGMSNPTFFVTCGERRLVLRKKPPVVLSPAAHRIDREYRLLNAFAGSDVRAPRPVLYCEDTSIIGTAFYLMERLEGVVSHDYALPGLENDARCAAYPAMAQALAAIHTFDWQAAGLGDFGKPGNYFARQIEGWSRQWQQFGITDNPAVDTLEAWLRAELPDDDGCATIAHGDYRAANVMFARDGSVSGVFDWELATIGHPLADLGFCLQGWFLGPDENGGVAGLDLAPLGIPTAAQFVESYYAAAPEMPTLTAFPIVFAMYRAAVGVSGVAVRARSGAVPDPAASAEASRFARSYAQAGLHAIDSGEF